MSTEGGYKYRYYRLLSATKQDERTTLQGKQLLPDLARPSNRSFYTATQYPSSTNSETPTIDDLTIQLSRTRLDSRPSTEDHQLAPVTRTRRKDAIEQVITSVLTQDLSALGNQKLLPDHPCFDLIRQFAKKWHISEEAITSNIKLSCGYLKFPVIMLLNPAPKHEDLSFDKMVDSCTTLRWIEDVLLGIGLDLADVIILDICPLLSNARISQLKKEGGGRKEQALSEAYDLTQKILEMLRPSIVISCQCSTSWTNWAAGGCTIASELCSSLKAAEAGEVKKVDLGGHAINVVQAYHPSGFLNYKRRGRHHHECGGKFLEELLERLYVPCASWRSQQIMALKASVNNSIAASTNILTLRKIETDRKWNRRAERRCPASTLVPVWA